MPELTLAGCAPIPLAHYLKALGVLRLVAESEHGDANATARWANDELVLTSHFDREALVSFFLRNYSPTAILAPWNGGSGFYLQEEKLKEKDPLTGKKLKTGKRNQPTEATRVVEAFANSTDPRFSMYRSAIAETRSILKRHGFDSAPDGGDKDDLLVELRGRWPDDAVRWLDCVLVLTADNSRARSRTGLLPSYTTLLGSGANDGNADFSSNFMQRLQSVLLDEDNITSGRAGQWLCVSLLGDALPGATVKALAGQYSPGNAGGPNMSPGFKGDFSVNPWDFILLIEGALAFAAAAVKRHADSGTSALAYSFAVRTSGVGYASGSPKDEVADKSQTEELWLPLWERSTSMNELLAVLSEGRAQIGKSAATTGVDFARAVCANGTDRGFTEFVRYGFLIRRGDSSSATPLGRFRVRRNARVDCLGEIDGWLERLRRQASPSAKKVPASVARTLNQLERRILELCRDGGKGTLLAVFAALGTVERALARSFKWTTSKEVRLQPLRGLGPRWLDEVNDASPEFRLAAALAGVHARFGYGKETLWFRQHLEPLERVERGQYFHPAWTDKSSENDVAWHDGDLGSALNAILARRLVRFERADTRGWPDFSPQHPLAFARLDDITAFIECRVNEELLADLLWGLSCVDFDRIARERQPLALAEARTPNGETDAVPSAFYSLLKLCFHRLGPGETPVPLVPGILLHAMSGQGEAASELAARRLHASGYRPLVKSLPVSGEVARRTAAAILFPVSHNDFFRLKQSITHQPKDQNT